MQPSSPSRKRSSGLSPPQKKNHQLKTNTLNNSSASVIICFLRLRFRRCWLCVPIVNFWFNSAYSACSVKQKGKPLTSSLFCNFHLTRSSGRIISTIRKQRSNLKNYHIYVFYSSLGNNKASDN